MCMRRELFAVFLFVVGILVSDITKGVAAAADAEPQEVVAKAIKALGGEDNLKKAAALAWKTTGMVTFGDSDFAFSSEVKLQGRHQYYATFSGDFNGNRIDGVTVVNGDQAWRKFGTNLLKLEAAELANEKRSIYLLIVPMLVLPLRDKDVQLELIGEQKFGEKTGVTLKVTGPDKKSFQLSFDKETGLPMRLLATTVGFDGQEFEQETTFGKYQDFHGIQRATKIRNKRDGKTFSTQDITEFVVQEQHPAETFAEPK